MSKYNWDNVPDWVQWIFTDQDGDIFGCNNKPCDKESFHGNSLSDKWEFLGKNSPIDWQDSLEERP